MAQVRRGPAPPDRQSESLNLLYRFVQHWPLALCCGVLFAIAGLIYGRHYQPLYHAEAQVRVGDSLESKSIPGQPADPGDVVDLPETLASGFRARVVVDPKLRELVAGLLDEPRLSHLGYLHTEKGRDELIDHIKKDVQVDPVTRRVYRIIYEAPDPDLVQIVVQRLAEAGVEDVARERSKNAQSARQFLSAETEAARQHMLAAENEVVRFLRDHPRLMVNTSSDGKAKLGLGLQDRLLVDGKPARGGLSPLRELDVTLASPKVRQLLQQRADLEARVSRIESAQKFDGVQTKINQIDKLQEQLQDLKAQNYTADYPEYQRITRDIERLKGEIRDSSKQRDADQTQDLHTLQDAKDKIAAIDREITSLRHKAQGPEKPPTPDEHVLSAEAEYSRLLRDLDSARAAYEKLHERELDAQVNEELSKVKGNLAARIEDPAKRPMYPRGVSRKMMTALCVMLGLLLGLGAGLLRAFTDPLIYTVYDLAKASRLPVLGRVPRSDGNGVGALTDVAGDWPEPALPGRNGSSSTQTPKMMGVIMAGAPEGNTPPGGNVAGNGHTPPGGNTVTAPAATLDTGKNGGETRRRGGEYMVVYSASRTAPFAQITAAAEGMSADVAVWSDKGIPLAARPRSGIFASPQSAAFRLAGMGHTVHKGQLPEHPQLFMLSASEGARAEQYRLLRCRLQDGSDPHVIVVSSALRGEGKTLSAANLALAYAEGGAHSVILIDANLGAPRLTEMLGAMPRAEALSEADLTAGGLDVWQYDTNLFLVPALGPRTKRSMVLSSPAFAMLVQDLRQVFEYVIIDAPAVASAADAKIVLRNADAGLFLTRARSTPSQAVRVALDRLGRGSMAGVVLNEF